MVASSGLKTVTSPTNLRSLTPEAHQLVYLSQALGMFVYLPGSFAADDDFTVFRPDSIDASSPGRYVLHSYTALSSAIICGSSGSCGTCAVGGKVVRFEDSYGDLRIKVQPDGISGAGAIEVHKWNIEPTTSGTTGRVWVAALPSAGGIVTIEIDSTYRWFSVFARNAANSNYYDATCLTLSERTLLLKSF